MFHAYGPVHRCASLSDFKVAPASQRFEEDKQVAYTLTLVRVVGASRSTRDSRNRLFDISGQLLAGLVKANEWVSGVIGLVVKV